MKDIVESIDLILKSQSTVLFILIIIICVMAWALRELYLERKADKKATNDIIKEFTNELADARDVMKKQTKVLILIAQNTDTFKNSGIDLENLLS